MSMVIIIGLFFVQSRGTAKVAAWFGPIMMIWFIVMAIGGIIHLADDLSILGAINPCLRRYDFCLRMVTPAF